MGLILFNDFTRDLKKGACSDSMVCLTVQRVRGSRRSLQAEQLDTSWQTSSSTCQCAVSHQGEGNLIQPWEMLGSELSPPVQKRVLRLVVGRSLQSTWKGSQYNQEGEADDQVEETRRLNFSYPDSK